MGRARTLSLTLVVVAAGCGSGGASEVEITERRRDPGARVVGTPSSAERFRAAGDDGGHAGGLQHVTPSGWETLPPTEFRHVNFRIPGEPPAECYVTVLGEGGGGGLLANLNRWRGQLGLAPVGEAELAALPRRMLMGHGDAVWVELEGTFSAPDGQRPGSKLLGVLLAHHGKLVTVKLVGPAALVEANRAKLDELASSLRSDDHD